MQIREILSTSIYEQRAGGTKIPLTVRGGPRQTLKSKADYHNNNFLKLLQSLDSGGATTVLKKFLQKELKIMQKRAQAPSMSWKSRKRAEHLLGLLRKKSVRQNQNYRKLHQSFAVLSTLFGTNIYSLYAAYIIPIVTYGLNMGNLYFLVEEYKRDRSPVDLALIAWYFANLPIDMLGGSILTLPVELADGANIFMQWVNKDDSAYIEDDDAEKQFTDLINDFGLEVESIQINPIIDSLYKNLDQIDRAAENLHHNPDLDNAKREVARMYPDLPKEYIEEGPLPDDLLDAVDNGLGKVLNVTKIAREAMKT